MNLQFAIMFGFAFGVAFGVAWFIGVLATWATIRTVAWLVLGIYHWRPAMSGYTLFKTTQIYMESIGRAYWFLEFDGSLPVPSKVWLLRSQMVQEIFADDGSGRINYYQYGGPTGINYDPKQIVRFADPDPWNPYIGSLSPMMAAIEKIRMSRRGDAQINAILENAARPDAVWSPSGSADGGGMLGAVEARRMEVALNQKFREAGNGSIMVSPVPGTLQILGWKPADIVELERAKMLKSEIGFIFGVPAVAWLVLGIYHWFIEELVTNHGRSWNLSDW